MKMKLIVPIYVYDKLYIPQAVVIKDALEILIEQFTYKNPEYYKKRSMGFWTGNLYRTMTTCEYIDHPKWGKCLTIPRGGTNKLRDVFHSNDIQYKFIDKRLLLPPINGYKNNVHLRPDQYRLAEAMFQKENCLIRSPTGSGKTETALKVVEWILKVSGPVIIIVWESGLFEQWIERISIRFDISPKEIGRIQGGKPKTIRPITVAMQQTLIRYGHKYTHLFGGLIADEVQRFAANTYQHVINIFPAKYRVGISADERRKDQLEFLIYDAFGEVADEIKQAKLIREGKIMDVIQRIIPTNFQYSKQYGETEYSWTSLPAEEKTKSYKDMIEYLLQDPERNNLIWKFIKANLIANHTIVIVVQRRFSAMYWEAVISKAGYSTGLMLGGIKYQEKFQETISGLKKGTIQVGIGTIQKFGQGHDIPNINRGFILSPLAGNTQQYEQVIGRLRRTSEGKDNAICYYFWDKFIYPGHKQKIAKNYPNSYLWVEDQFLKIP